MDGITAQVLCQRRRKQSIESDLQVHKQSKIGYVRHTASHIRLRTAAVTTLDRTGSRESVLSNREGEVVVALAPLPPGVSEAGFTAIAGLPAGAVAVDDTVTVAVVDVLDASGLLPGNFAGLIVDITLSSGQNTIAEPFTVSFSYPDADQDGLVDDTQIDETTLTLFVFDAVLDTWVPIPDAVVYPEVNRVEGTLETLGEVGLFSTESPLMIATGDQSSVPETSLSVSGDGA